MKKAINVFILSLCVSMGYAHASFVIDFEDAYSSLGYSNNPTNTYSNSGLTINGSYFGLLGGDANGDPGNFNLNGTNGDASLGVNTIGHDIDFVFDQAYYVQFDLGVANSQTSEITIVTYNGRSSSTNVQNFTSDGSVGGTWTTLQFADVDRIHLTASGNWRAWGIDNIQVSAIPEPSTYAMIGLGILVIGAYLLKRRRA